MLPVRGATDKGREGAGPLLISIHAPRAGSDLNTAFSRNLPFDFNPCSPCGERPDSGKACKPGKAFQSMLPVRGATFVMRSTFFISAISIHAPRAGSDDGRQSG